MFSALNRPLYIYTPHNGRNEVTFYGSVALSLLVFECYGLSVFTRNAGRNARNADGTDYRKRKRCVTGRNIARNAAKPNRYKAQVMECFRSRPESVTGRHSCRKGIERNEYGPMMIENVISLWALRGVEPLRGGFPVSGENARSTPSASFLRIFSQDSTASGPCHRWTGSIYNPGCEQRLNTGNSDSEITRPQASLTQSLMQQASKRFKDPGGAGGRLPSTRPRRLLLDGASHGETWNGKPTVPVKGADL
jgi:hypothetical protein